MGLWMAVVVAVGAVLLAQYCRPAPDYMSTENEIHASYNSLLKTHTIGIVGGADGEGQPQTSSLLSVMTFNIRHDIPESDPANNYPRRLPRIQSVVHRWQPDIIGLQEPYASQVKALLESLHGGDGRAHYGVVGYGRMGLNWTEGMDTAERRSDFQTAILYRSDRFELVDSHHSWLSDTPAVEGSRSWGSVGVRTATVAVLAPRSAPATAAPVIVVNTHLDHACEAARRGQAAALKALAEAWQSRWPTAAVVVTGDFNSAPGQAAHRTLTSNMGALVLSDAWEVCSSVAGCVRHSPVATTFHGWFGGAVVNSWWVRALLMPLFSLHAMQFPLPHHIPSSLRQWARAIRDVLTQPPEYSLAESMPSGGGRYHLDWVLHSPHLVPLMVAVVDVRTEGFSSDHFPVLAMLRYQ